MSQDKIKIHYIKSNHFKSFFSSGAYGGLGPNGLINMGFYIERPTIPVSIVHEIKPDGNLGNEIKEERVGREGVVREIDCNIMLDINTARNVRTWLDQHIKMLELIVERQTPKST